MEKDWMFFSLRWETRQNVWDHHTYFYATTGSSQFHKARECNKIHADRKKERGKKKKEREKKERKKEEKKKENCSDDIVINVEFPRKSAQKTSLHLIHKTNMQN